MAKKRTPAKPRKGRSKARATRKTSWLTTLFRFFLKLGVLALVIGAIGMFYLDAQIRQKFEGKRWALPAKVYARPLELYEGLPISLADLKVELKGLGYQTVSQPKRPGQVAFSKTRAHVFTRGFQFPDGAERSQQLMIEFSGNQLTGLAQRNGSPLSLTRLEPVLIGGIYARDNEDRDLIRLEDAPQGLTDGLIAIEDRAYYDHFGVSPKGIARAMWVNIRAGRFIQGGSTLTQQLIKNFYLTSERTLWRKLMEIPMAVVLDLRYSKEEILEAYLNEVYLGQEGARAIHGFGMGAQYYFGQPIQELQLHQLALLAGLVKGPSYYDPRRNPERAKERRDLVLKVMADQGDISQADYKKYAAKPLGVVKQKSLLKGAYPAYLDLVKRKLRESYRQEDLGSEGLVVYTSLDPITQSKAESALVKTIAQLEKKYPAKLEKQLEGSVVVSDPQTGEVVAIVGGRSTRYQGFNRALDAVRPIGSLIKPAVFLSGLQHGYTLATMLEDTPLSVEIRGSKPWQPKNFDRRSHGLVPFYLALAKSYNLSTARLGMALGLDEVLDTIEDLGVEREFEHFPSLLLGAQGMTPTEVATMYQTIAANGFQMPLRAIRSVTDQLGNELSRYPFKLKQTVDSRDVYQLQFAMQEVARSGTAQYAFNRLPKNLHMAGKTGTSNDQRDSWFAGFTGNRLAVFWLGRDDNKPLPFTGSGGALRAWTEFMKQERPTPLQVAQPEGIEFQWIDVASGYLSDRICPGSKQLPFETGQAPDVAIDCGQFSEKIEVEPQNLPAQNSKPEQSWLERLLN